MRFGTGTGTKDARELQSCLGINTRYLNLHAQTSKLQCNIYHTKEFINSIEY